MCYLTGMLSIDACEDSEMLLWIQIIENNVLLWTQVSKKIVSIQN